MVDASFTHFGILPSYNDVHRADRQHWAVGFKKRQGVKERLSYCILAERVPVFIDPVCIEVTWYERDRRRDRDNIRSSVKFILDALVEMGRLKSDSQKFVHDIKDVWPEPDKKNPRVVVKITEMSTLMSRQQTDQKR